MGKWVRLIFVVICCELVGAVGSIFTVPAIPLWYSSLNKPWFTPPGWIFAPVWILLYFLMGVSLFLIWESGCGSAKVKDAPLFFLLQLFLNGLWTFLFFGLQSPVIALLDILLLIQVILITIVKFWKISRLAGHLLFPYLIWVIFAALLNLSIVLLNPA